MSVKYRPITDLTDEEIATIITDMFAPNSIRDITRFPDRSCISAKITTTWNDKKSEFEMTDEVFLYEPGTRSYLIDLDYDFDYDIESERWEQFCIAKGCHSLLKDNKYIQE